MTKRLLVVALLASMIACGNSQKDKCSAATDTFIANVLDKMLNMFGSDKMSEKEKKDMDMMKTMMKSLMVSLCTDDKWSDEELECLKTATLETAQKCNDLLTPEQRAHAEKVGAFGGARKKESDDGPAEKKPKPDSTEKKTD